MKKIYSDIFGSKQSKSRLLASNEERKKRAFSETSQVLLSADNNESESDVFLEAADKINRKIFPVISHLIPSTFAVYGSAEKYYRDAFQYIHSSYPYDGSRYERVAWALTASVVDLAILEHEYPKAVGHLRFSNVVN